MKYLRIFLIISSILVIIYIYFGDRSSLEAEQNQESEGFSLGVEMSLNEKKSDVVDRDDEQGLTEGKLDIDFSIEVFFQTITDSDLGSEPYEVEGSFDWYQNGRINKVTGDSISFRIGSNDHSIEEFCLAYLERSGFEYDQENVEASDGGESIIGMKNGNSVCLLETIPHYYETNGLFRSSCGNL